MQYSTVSTAVSGAVLLQLLIIIITCLICLCLCTLCCVCVCVCALDDSAEASQPPQISSVLPGSEQDDVSEPGSVFRPRAAQPASGGVLPHQSSLHRLRGAGQRAALQETHRSPALPAPALAR